MRDVGKIIPVVMSGHAENGYDPVLPVTLPKPFQKSACGLSLIQETVQRYNTDMFHPPVFICAEDHVSIIQEQMLEINREIGPIIVEPVMRGTAICAVVAAHYARLYDPEALVLLTTCDHHIEKPQAFRRCIAAAMPVVRDSYILTFGMNATRAETHHGYIRKGELLKPGTYLVDHFVYMPSRDQATEFLRTGQYFWNSGTVLFAPETLLPEIQKFQPDVSQYGQLAFENAAHCNDVISLPTEYYLKCPDLAFDKGVLALTDSAALIVAPMGWSHHHQVSPVQAIAS